MGAGEPGVTASWKRPNASPSPRTQLLLACGRLLGQPPSRLPQLRSPKTRSEEEEEQLGAIWGMSDGRMLREGGRDGRKDGLGGSGGGTGKGTEGEKWGGARRRRGRGRPGGVRGREASGVGGGPCELPQNRASDQNLAESRKQIPPTRTPNPGPGGV